jgi:uncharacterized protein (DUF58 family)
MALPSTQPRITPLLPNDVLSRVERMRLRPQKRLTNRSRGEHVAGRAGSSIEFKDYRDYTPGDDTRFVDWNIFSRLHRPYLKLFHEEEEMHIVLLIDASSSMRFEGKLDRAKSLAAAFGVMGLIGTEKVSVCVFNQKENRVARLRPHSGRASRRALFHFLEPIEGGGDRTIESGIDAMLTEHRGRGLAIVLSDFLTTGNLKRSFNLLYSAGLEMMGMQILGPTEINPEITSDLRLVDSETGKMLDISSGGDILKLYTEYREAYQTHVAALAQSRMGRLVTVNAKDTLEFVLFDLLRRKGWIR